MMRAYSKPLDFFARRLHFVDHMAPIWRALHEKERGHFYVPETLMGHALNRGVAATALQGREDDAINVLVPNGIAPILVSAYGDMQSVKRNNPQRPIFMMEHGVGLTFDHPGYAGGTGLRRSVKFFLAPNEFIRRKTAKALGAVPQAVIGTPKLDGFAKAEGGRQKAEGGKRTVAISFHWDGKRVAAEAGNAFEHYKFILPVLAERDDYHLIGHGHPKFMHYLAPIYESLGVEIVWDFSEVMERADLYVNDCSSTMYEFLVTGKPVVMMNAPWFRRDVNFGIRFWDYADIGPQVERAEDLPQVIAEQLAGGSEAFREAREKTVRELYPFLGQSAARAAGALVGFMEGKRG
jgi:hypothetical protein